MQVRHKRCLFTFHFAVMKHIDEVSTNAHENQLISKKMMIVIVICSQTLMLERTIPCQSNTQAEIYKIITNPSPETVFITLFC